MASKKGVAKDPKSMKPRIVCCIGDVHSHMTKLRRLWTNLETLIGPSDFGTSLVTFLGDYCERGPDTRKVIDFLISLPSKYQKQSHVFLCGNHELAFGAFLGVLPSSPDASVFSETWKEYEINEERERWYKAEGFKNMHLQERIWVGNHKDTEEIKHTIQEREGERSGVRRRKTRERERGRGGGDGVGRRKKRGDDVARDSEVGEEEGSQSFSYPSKLRGMLDRPEEGNERCVFIPLSLN